VNQSGGGGGVNRANLIKLPIDVEQNKCFIGAKSLVSENGEL
jgi:hypothetical protein